MTRLRLLAALMLPCMVFGCEDANIQRAFAILDVEPLPSERDCTDEVRAQLEAADMGCEDLDVYAVLTDPPTIQMGDVALFGLRRVRFRIGNKGTGVISLKHLAVAEGSDEGFTPEQLVDDTHPLSLQPGSTTVISFLHEAREVGEFNAEFHVGESSTRAQSMWADGAVVDLGAPDIEVEPEVLDFGLVPEGEGSLGTVTIRNVGDRPLTVRSLELADNIDAEGTPVFELASSTVTPFCVDAAAVSCDAFAGAAGTGEQRLLVRFKPPTSAVYEATLIIETNVPGKEEFTVSLIGRGGVPPVAVASFRAPDPLNPSAPYTNPETILPLDTVHFDALDPGNPSFDPGGNDPLDFTWTVIEQPIGSTAAVAPDPGNPRFARLFIDLAGRYKLSLRATNTLGLASLHTEDSEISFEAIPDTAVHVQLVWDHPSSDMDLHVINLNGPEGTYTSTDDCYYANKTPVWHAETPNANPTLDIDDVNGYGPENINIREPVAGIYRVLVHDFRNDTGDNTCTLRIYLNGLLSAEYAATMHQTGDLWTIADIEWFDDAPPTINTIDYVGFVSFGGGF